MDFKIIRAGVRFKGTAVDLTLGPGFTLKWESLGDTPAICASFGVKLKPWVLRPCE